GRGAFLVIINHRRKAEGRGQKAEGKILFSLCQKGLKPLNLFMKKKKRFFPHFAQFCCISST
ncbi:MAG TPA: hypothetical protein DCL61_03785, partial [Cyanobacteria bacterium UBA12227]|nr:hypothetical protein [Cyanobacteria bacterium UBA12227]